MPKQRPRSIVDEPLLTAREAGLLFNCSDRKFMRKFNECLHREIRVANVAARRFFLQIDVMRAAYPQLKDDVIGMMCLKNSWNLAHKRQITMGRPSKTDESGGNT